MVINSKKNIDNGRLESRQKMKTNHVGPSILMTTTPTSPSTSSPSVTHESSSIIACGSSPPLTYLCILYPHLLPIEEPSIEDDGKLLLGHKYLSTRELQSMIDKWKASVLETAKRQMCATESLNGSQKSLLSKLDSSLQAFLAKATVISLGLDESVNRVKANQKELEGTWESTREQYLKMKKENEVLYK
ncbi:hypothetical protein J1N35_019653 [Gossypium stocksii]|uniref:Uncharacterized protein n=1 Tax=Gossypium stocksii TaxID=47602 RepID=A0A9D4A8F2_9ROSI|nr:hypothetical protein J1N35_019653 [Gossypium stocksii]